MISDIRKIVVAYLLALAVTVGILHGLRVGGIVRPRRRNDEKEEIEQTLERVFINYEENSYE